MAKVYPAKVRYLRHIALESNMDDAIGDILTTNYGMVIEQISEKKSKFKLINAQIQAIPNGMKIKTKVFDSDEFVFVEVYSYNDVLMYSGYISPDRTAPSEEIDFDNETQQLAYLILRQGVGK